MEPDVPLEYPDWLQAKVVSELTTIQPDQVIRGLLYKGCKLALMGGSKSFKTWAQMDMAYCVANGFRWWGIHVMQLPVVYMDFELLDYDFRLRMEMIHKAHIAMGDKGGSIDAIKRIGLRSKVLQDYYWDKIHELILEEKAGLTLCDPTYKLLGGRDENKAGDVAQVVAMFDRLTEATGSALIYAQHFSKGNQSQKESIDRGAGSGVWGRDSDTILTMTKHDEDDCLTVECTLRSFQRIDPFVVRWDNPLFVRDSSLKPEDLKQPGNAGRKPKWFVKDLVDCLNGDRFSTGDFQEMVETETGMTRATFHRVLKEAQQQGLLNKSKVDNKWEKINEKNHKGS